MLAADRPSWRITISTQDRAKTVEGKNGPRQQSRPGARQGESEPSSATAHTAPTPPLPHLRERLSRPDWPYHAATSGLTAAIRQTMNIDDNDRFRFKGSLIFASQGFRSWSPLPHPWQIELDFVISADPKFHLNLPRVKREGTVSETLG